jgi:hypothetical protein
MRLDFCAETLGEPRRHLSRAATRLFHEEDICRLRAQCPERLYPFLRIGLKTNAVCGLRLERLKFGLSQLRHSNRSLAECLPREKS